MKKEKMTVGDKVVQIVRLSKITYNQIYKIEDNNIKMIKQLEKEYEDKVKEIINS